MSGLILQKGRKYFVPSTHTWLKITSLFSDTKNLKYMTQVQLSFEVGITDRGLDDIGDITSIQFPLHSTSASNTQQNTWCKVKKDQEILNIHWDAHFITKADELYHTIWETIDETTSIKSPVDGVCVGVNDFSAQKMKYRVHSDTSLFSMRTSMDHLQELNDQGQLMDCEEYTNYVKTLEAGVFFDPDQS